MINTIYHKRRNVYILYLCISVRLVSFSLMKLITACQVSRSVLQLSFCKINERFSKHFIYTTSSGRLVPFVMSDAAYKTFTHGSLRFKSVNIPWLSRTNCFLSLVESLIDKFKGWCTTHPFRNQVVYISTIFKKLSSWINVVTYKNYVLLWVFLFYNENWVSSLNKGKQFSIRQLTVNLVVFFTKSNIVPFIMSLYYLKLYVINHSRILFQCLFQLFTPYFTGWQRTTMKLDNYLRCYVRVFILPSFSFTPSSSCFVVLFLFLVHCSSVSYQHPSFLFFLQSSSTLFFPLFLYYLLIRFPRIFISFAFLFLLPYIFLPNT